MPLRLEPVDHIAEEHGGPAAPGHVQADAVAAALDKVLQVPTESNRFAAVAAMQAYFAATEHLWNDSPTIAPP